MFATGAAIRSQLLYRPHFIAGVPDVMIPTKKGTNTTIVEATELISRLLSSENISTLVKTKVNRMLPVLLWSVSVRSTKPYVHLSRLLNGFFSVIS